MLKERQDEITQQRTSSRNYQICTQLYIKRTSTIHSAAQSFGSKIWSKIGHIRFEKRTEHTLAYKPSLLTTPFRGWGWGVCVWENDEQLILFMQFVLHAWWIVYELLWCSCTSIWSFLHNKFIELEFTIIIFIIILLFHFLSQLSAQEWAHCIPSGVVTDCGTIYLQLNAISVEVQPLADLTRAMLG